MDKVSEISMGMLSGGQSSKVAISTASAQSAAFSVVQYPSVLVTADVACFGRFGSNPTALGTGVDQYFAAGATYRVDLQASGIGSGKFAFIALTGTGNVYLTPGA